MMSIMKKRIKVGGGGRAVMNEPGKGCLVGREGWHWGVEGSGVQRALMPGYALVHNSYRSIPESKLSCGSGADMSRTGSSRCTFPVLFNQQRHKIIVNVT